MLRMWGIPAHVENLLGGTLLSFDQNIEFLHRFAEAMHSMADRMAKLLSIQGRIEYLKTQRDGMISENEVCRRLGKPMPYRDEDFFSLSREFAELSIEAGGMAKS